MRTLTVAEATYIAGYLDGEGSITVRKEKRVANTRGWRLNPVVAMFNTHLASLEWVQETCGTGSLRQGATKGKNWKPHYKQVWGLWFNANAARDLLPQLLPYLKIKREAAELLLEYLGFVTQGERMTPEQEIRAWEIAGAIQKRRTRVTIVSNLDRELAERFGGTAGV